MRMSLQYWDDTSGLDLQSSDFEAKVLMGSGNGMAPATPNYIDLGTTNPIPSGKTLAGTLYTFQVKLKGTTDAAKEVQRDTLNKWFRPDDFVFRKLVGFDIDNSNKDWYLEGYTVTAPMLVPSSVNDFYNITIALKEPYWIEYDLQTTTWTVTTDTDTKDVTAAGNIPTPPKFEITPQAGKGSNSYLKKTFYAIHTSGWGGVDVPVNIVGTVLDTAALIGAGDMQADGDDSRVSINGVQVGRWFGGGGINSATTKIFANMKFTAAPTMLLSVTLANAGTPATLSATYTGNLPSVLSQNSTLQCENELFTYSTYTINTATQTIVFTLVERNAKGSTIAGHAIGQAVYWIENEVWHLYKNSAATAPDIDDTKKPAFDLVNTTNALWVYTTFGAMPIQPSKVSMPTFRPAQPVMVGTIKGFNTYGGVNYGALLDPMEAVGLANINNSYVGTRPTNQAGAWNYPTVAWMFYHPGGISNFLTAGEKRFESSNPTWPTLVGLNTRADGLGTVISAVAIPSTINTWEAININQAIATNPDSVYFVMAGEQIPTPIAFAELQSASQTNFDPPTVTAMGVAQENYSIGGSGGFLENTETGDIILFNNVVTKTTLTLTIDCENQEVYNEDGKRVRGMLAFDGDKRDDWMTLLPGVNTLSFSDTGTSNLDIVVTHRARNTI